MFSLSRKPVSAWGWYHSSICLFFPLPFVCCMAQSVTHTWGFLYTLWLWCDSIVIMNWLNTKIHTFLWGVGIRRFWWKLNQFYKRKHLVLKLISQYLNSVHYGTWPWCPALLFFSCSTCDSYIGILELLFCLLSQTAFYLVPVCQKDKDLVSPSVSLPGVKNTSVPLEERLLIITSSFLHC